MVVKGLKVGENFSKESFRHVTTYLSSRQHCRRFHNAHTYIRVDLFTPAFMSGTGCSRNEDVM